MPSTSVFLSAMGHPSIVPLTGSTNGHSPSPHEAGAMTVSRPMGKCRYSPPPRTDSATHHLQCQQAGSTQTFSQPKLAYQFPFLSWNRSA